MSHFVQKLAQIEADQQRNKQLAGELEARLAKLELGKTQTKDEETKKEKSASQLKKEAKQKEKDEKFQAKQQKLKTVQAQSKEPKAKSEEKKDKEPQCVLYTSKTSPGEKKDTKCQLPDAYSPRYVEAAWYQWWEKMGFFKPEIADKYFKLEEGEEREKFVMAMPPPNVTGTLHLGHALMCSIEDVLTRWHRMLGHETLWCPGFDHAGIATQVVVEKKLKREQNKTRHDLGREAFVAEIWKWKSEKGDSIAHQLKRIGSSCDWDRARFTMDDVSVKAVLETFIQMHQRGLIYRSKRLVNWSCALNSAISDIEVDKTALKGRTMLAIPGYKQKIEFGTLTSFAYRVVQSKESDVETGEEIVVATTRPETMLGDTAICVHPSDDRYKHLVGKYVTHPFVERKIAIIADQMVDAGFGTGAVKITPAHDANDFECGKRHGLAFITVIDDKGCMTAECGQFAAMKRFDARKAVVEALKERGLFKEIKETETVLPLCSRSKDVIEPMLKSQWYVNCKEMAAKAVSAVRDKRLKIIPDFHEQVWYRWLEDCHDWCISRQLWWGHRIPAYHIRIKGQAQSDDTDNNYWVSAHDRDLAMQKALARFPELKADQMELHHDEDVLDTWFSSGIFPFSICGWPEKTSDLEKYYPGTLLETGHDILFFWVARMVMMGEEMCGNLPFDTIYLHAIIRDAHGRKMSKSLGNIIDPLDVIDGITLENLNKQLENYNLDPKEVEKAIKGQKEDFPNGIPECGTDALRFALCAYTAQGRDINLDVLRIQGYRHFCNKLWNATKFAMMNGLSSTFVPKDSLDYLKTNLANLRAMDKWMLSRLSETVKICDSGFRAYDLTSVTTALFNYWLYDLCDYYIEYLKPSFYAKDEQSKALLDNSREVLYTCLDIGLRLISPLMPFISEELYQRLPRRKPDSDPPSICVTRYPLPKDFDLFRNSGLEMSVKLSQEAINKIRSLRSDYQLTIKTKTDVYVKSIDAGLEQALKDFQDLILTMTNGKMIEFLADGKEQPNGCAFTTLSDKCKIYIMLKGIVDVEKEEVKLSKKKDLLLKSIENLKKEMAKPDYGTRVPESVRAKNQDKMSQLTNEVTLIDDGLKQLQNMKS